MAVTLLPRKPYDHKARVRLRIDGGPELKGWTSPVLDGRGDARRGLILLTVSDKDLPHRLQLPLAKFREVLRKFDSRGVSAAKRAVVAIQSGESPLPGLRIAAHKMGPVPALELKDGEVAFANGERARVVLFPRSIAEDRGEPHGPSTLKSDMINCLVAIDSSLLFQSYFQDIFQHLREMSDKLSLPDSMPRLKHIREIQAQSIIEKLEYLTPSPHQWEVFRRKSREARPALDQTAETKVCQWFENNWIIVAEAIHCLCSTNRLLHDYCTMIGLPIARLQLSLKGQTYQFPTALKSFENAYGLHADPMDFSSMGENFAKVMDEYHNGDVGRMARLRDVDDESKNALTFALFVTFCREELSRIFGASEYVYDDTIVFISRRFASSFGERVKRAVDKAVSGLSEGAPAVTTFVGDPGDVQLRERIKAQIWLSDATWAVIPELDEAVGENLDWTYLEPEHALVLNNPWVYIARTRHELEKALSRMSSFELEPLSNTYYGNRQELRETFLAQSKGNLAITCDDEEAIADQCRTVFSRQRMQAGVMRRRELLFGYLSFFSPDDIDVFQFMLDHFERRTFTRREFSSAYARSLKTRPHFRNDNLENLEKKADRTFYRVYSRSKRLAIRFQDRPLQIIMPTKVRNHKIPEYRLQLVRIAIYLASARRRITEEQAGQDVRHCLNRF